MSGFALRGPATHHYDTEPSAGGQRQGLGAEGKLRRIQVARRERAPGSHRACGPALAGVTDVTRLVHICRQRWPRGVWASVCCEQATESCGKRPPSRARSGPKPCPSREVPEEGCSGRGRGGFVPTRAPGP